MSTSDTPIPLRRRKILNLRKKEDSRTSIDVREKMGFTSTEEEVQDAIPSIIISPPPQKQPTKDFIPEDDTIIEIRGIIADESYKDYQKMKDDLIWMKQDLNWLCYEPNTVLRARDLESLKNRMIVVAVFVIFISLYSMASFYYIVKQRN